MSSVYAKDKVSFRLYVFHRLWEAGIVPKTRDVDIIAALLSVREGDTFYTSTFSKMLKITYLVRDDSPLEDRKEWSVSEKLADKLRAKATKQKEQA